MAAVSATPLFMRDVLLTLAVGIETPAEYQCHVTEARIAVEPGARVDIATLCSSGQFSEVGKATYALVLSGIQDWHANGDMGLSRYLWEHEGELAAFTLQAHGEDVAEGEATPGMSGQVTIIPGDYGGAINEYAVIDGIELPCRAKPALVTA
jgi:hypothetical protein